MSEKRILPAFLLNLLGLLGICGIHRFYIGKWATGILYFFTLGLFGIGWLYDFIVLACGGLKDGKGYKINEWM